MSDFNQEQNRAVWMDIPVADLDRACDFYAEVLAIDVHKAEFDDYKFGVLSHKDGNGGCLVPNPDGIAGDKGLLVYMNCEGRIKDAVAKVESKGGKIIEDVHAIGPHGFRALVDDSEGNRIALHSMVDA